VVVPPGAFQTPLQVTITEPDIAAIGDAGFCGYQAAAGIGVIIQNPDGSVNNSSFTHPLVVTISSPAIRPGDIIVAWNGVKFVRVGVAQNGGSVTVRLTHAGYNFFAVLEPTGVALDPCATSGGQGGDIGGAIGRFDGGLSAFNPVAHIGPGLAEAYFATLFGMPSGQLPGLGILAAQSQHTLAEFARFTDARSPI